MRIQWRCETTEKIKKFGFVGNRLFYEIGGGGYLLDYMDREWYNCGSHKKAIDKANKLLQKWEEELDAEPFCVILDWNGWQKYYQLAKGAFTCGRVEMEVLATYQSDHISDKIHKPVPVKTFTLKNKGRKKHGYPVFEL